MARKLVGWGFQPDNNNTDDAVVKSLRQMISAVGNIPSGALLKRLNTRFCRNTASIRSRDSFVALDAQPFGIDPCRTLHSQA